MLDSETILLVIIVAIILFGSSKIPELARSLGKATGEFKKAQRETELELKDFEKSVREGKSQDEKTSKIKQMASDLGITTEGKSDEQLLDEIKKKMPTVKSEK
ncbi:MAG: twin-arginine translocase TatA/TatE family subunit [Candidatus Methanoperedens sp.]|nr:twin-arginine translocase TatA/TatE family subunit [Candidatus Methanoperedens sp.]MCZ7395433.1 twin-arginine translocase TatA/TatE family subunit [Candidatus Methanoperedens sp.]